MDYIVSVCLLNCWICWELVIQNDYESDLQDNMWPLQNHRIYHNFDFDCIVSIQLAVI